MTQAEIEAELASLRQQLSQMQQQQDHARNDRRRLAKTTGWLAVLFAATGMIMALVGLWAGGARAASAPIFSVFILSAIPLIFLSLALREGETGRS